ncbi:AMP-binding protein [Staphylococcus chromogenes]|uniref:AMP-binding protein n=1 Tax=Staphylococcus chromogenes TaxID=46126 RepID=UPI001E4EEBD3|nr:AMP-binding protein [Staphylococcus chromogenes]
MELLKRIEHYAKTEAQRVALYIDDEQLNYATLHERVKDTASRLPEYDLPLNVALSFSRIQDFVVAYLAVLSKGGTPWVMDANWSAARKKALYETYDIPYIWEDETFYQRQKQSRKSLASGVLHVGFTSGTTGLPKAFLRDEASWIASFEQNEKLMTRGRGKNHMLVALGPYAHSLTLYVVIYALFYGRTFLGQNDYHIERCASRIADYTDNCSLFLVPTMVYDWLQHASQNNHVSEVFISGDKLTEQRHCMLKRTLPSAAIYEFFGTSEASFISVNMNQTAPLNSVGKVFSNVQIDIRHQDRLIIGSKNVYPSVVEQQLKQLEGVQDVIIVRQPHTKFGEVAVALYTGTQIISYRYMRAQLEKVVSRYEIPSKWMRVEKLPYTSSGKVSRHIVQHLYEGGDFNE